MTSDPAGVEYALIVTSRRAVNRGAVVTRAGDRFWVVRETEGWVPATSESYREGEPPHGQLKTFPTVEAARTFANEWEGHPWWCVPRSFTVVTVRPVMKQVFDRYEIVVETPKKARCSPPSPSSPPRSR